MALIECIHNQCGQNAAAHNDYHLLKRNSTRYCWTVLLLFCICAISVRGSFALPVSIGVTASGHRLILHTPQYRQRYHQELLQQRRTSVQPIPPHHRHHLHHRATDMANNNISIDKILTDLTRQYENQLGSLFGLFKEYSKNRTVSQADIDSLVVFFGSGDDEKKIILVHPYNNKFDRKNYKVYIDIKQTCDGSETNDQLNELIEELNRMNESLNKLLMHTDYVTADIDKQYNKTAVGNDAADEENNNTVDQLDVDIGQVKKFMDAARENLKSYKTVFNDYILQNVKGVIKAESYDISKDPKVLNDTLQHMLLCREILGAMRIIQSTLLFWNRCNILEKLFQIASEQ